MLSLQLELVLLPTLKFACHHRPLFSVLISLPYFNNWSWHFQGWMSTWTWFLFFWKFLPRLVNCLEVWLRKMMLSPCYRILSAFSFRRPIVNELRRLCSRDLNLEAKWSLCWGCGIVQFLWNSKLWQRKRTFKIILHTCSHRGRIDVSICLQGFCTEHVAASSGAGLSMWW